MRRIVTAREQADMLSPWRRVAGFSSDHWGGGFYQDEKEHENISNKIREKERKRQNDQALEALIRNQAPDALDARKDHNKKMKNLLTRGA